MRVPLDWLKEFVEIKLSKEELAEKLTLAGLEVEKIDGDVLVLEVTPNRGDCLSILGVAREIAAITDQKLKTPHFAKTSRGKQNLDKPLEIKIAESKICPRYTYRIIEGVKVAPSPSWLQKRLEKVDIRPINNLVDVTNYVMIELGQPLHAFDYDKIENQKMLVRKGKKGESVITLDGIEREVDQEVLVIQDSQKLIDLAGIMGGQNSEVSNDTKTIILQAAIFDPILIRRTSKKLNLTTEASYRYERGVDFENTKKALDRATQLILETAGGQTGKIVDILKTKLKPRKIKIDIDKINDLLGINLSESEIKNYLGKLGFSVSNLRVFIPSFRARDVTIWQDIAEEVGRMFGFMKLPKTLLPPKEPASLNKKWLKKQQIKDILVDLGFSEIESYSYLSASDLKKVEIDPQKCLEVKNPLSPETQFLRPNLLPSILKQIAKNPWAPEVKVFEIGPVFDKGEREELIIALSGTKTRFIFPLKIKEKIKEVSGSCLKNFKIRRKVSYLRVDLEKLPLLKPKEGYNIPIKKIVYKPISKYPPVIFDLAVIISESVKSENIEEIIKQSSGDLLYNIELFDVYAGPQLPKGKKSFAYHLTFSSYSHTLKDEEIKKVRQKIITDLKEKLKASIRGESV